MPRLEREAHGLHIKFPTQTEYQLLGVGIDDMSVEMNGSFENSKDVTGQTSVTDNGYQPQVEINPYKANTDDPIYPFLKNIAGNRLSGDKAKAKYLETWVDDPDAKEHDAWEEDCYVEVLSYAGDTSALGIPFKIWPAGHRVQGKVKFVDGKPQFTPVDAALGD